MLAVSELIDPGLVGTFKHKCNHFLVKTSRIDKDNIGIDNIDKDVSDKKGDWGLFIK